MNPGPRRTALITGGTSGIGAATAARLRADGVDVITADIAGAADVVLDVTSPDDLARHADLLGRIDILINSAGIVGPNKPVPSVTHAEWRRTIEVNLDGAFLMTQAVLPGMTRRGWGRIVNLASVAGKEGNPNLAAYSASKGGLIAFTKAVAKEVARSGVVVNVVTPAVIATPMNANTSDDTLKYMIEKIPMGRTGEAAEVAELIRWLASDACSFSTGAVFDISGGRSTY